MVIIEKLYIDVEAHRLEAVLSRPAGPLRGAFVFCHPYPRYGGDMYNKVVVKAAQVLLEARYAVLRFNMRGTGKSEGSTPDHQGAREDLAGVMAWLSEREEGKGGPIKLAGYSYGAYIALSAPVTSGGILAIAYPASMPEFHLSRLPAAKLRFVHGTRDELVPAAQAETFFQTLRMERSVLWVEGANHTFDRRLDALQQACREALQAI